MKKEKEISPEKLKEVADEARNRLSTYLKRDKEHPEKGGLRPPEKEEYLRTALGLHDSPAVHNFLRLFVMIDEEYLARLKHNIQSLGYGLQTEEKKLIIESANGIIDKESNTLDRNIGELIRKAQNGETNIAVDVVPEQLRGALKEVLKELSSKQ